MAMTVSVVAALPPNLLVKAAFVKCNLIPKLKNNTMNWNKILLSCSLITCLSLNASAQYPPTFPKDAKEEYNYDLDVLRRLKSEAQAPSNIQISGYFGYDLSFMNSINYYESGETFKFEQSDFSWQNMNWGVSLRFPFKAHRLFLNYNEEHRAANYTAIINSTNLQFADLQGFDLRNINRLLELSYDIRYMAIALGTGYTETYFDEGELLHSNPGLLGTVTTNFTPLYKPRFQLGFGGGIRFRFNNKSKSVYPHSWMDIPARVYAKWMSTRIFPKKERNRKRRFYTRIGVLFEVLFNYKMLSGSTGIHSFDFFEFPVFRVGLATELGIE